MKEVPDSKDPGANMGPIWGRQDPDGPYVGPRNFPIWGSKYCQVKKLCKTDIFNRSELLLYPHLN